VSFDRSLASRSEALQLNAAESALLSREAKNLVAAKPPPELSPAKTLSVQQAIKRAYVTSFRTVSYVCAASVAVSTLATALLIPPRPTN
jgi:hypothetical protein